MRAARLARGLLRLAQAGLALPVGYQVLLAGVAIAVTPRMKRVRQGAPAQQQTRFAILVPAHNEEVLLGGVLRSLEAQDYPHDRFQTIVIADNCTDETAPRARAFMGTWVYERHDAVEKGKGQALRWMFERLEAEGKVFDAYVIIDADSVAEPDLLAGFARLIAQGAPAIQARYGVLNGEEAPSAALRWFALTLKNHVRPTGRFMLGWSTQLLGNGMCLTRSVLTRHPWRASALSEDYQYYLTLAEAGVRVWYLPDSGVRSHMPTRFDQLRTQDIRWESPQPNHGEWRSAWRLLRAGLAHRDPVWVEASWEAIAPPLSPQVAGLLVTTVASVLLDDGSGLFLSAALDLGLLFFLSSAFVVARPPQMLFKALWHVPEFVAWKLWVYFVLSRSKKHTSTWVRTNRPTTVSDTVLSPVPSVPSR